jgi:dehydrogenase/reductase SDR family protein 7B
MISFHNKVIWVTGASSGIGEAVAKALALKGAILILSSRKEPELERVKNELQGENVGKTRILPLDLAVTNSLAEKAQEALSYFGRVDVLVASGGISQRSIAVETSTEVDQRLMDVNFFGTVVLAKAILPTMIENGFGYIVPISSLVGKFGSPYRSAYAASKHALHGFFDSLRAENYQKNIYVTIVTPGFIKTNVSVNALTEDGKALNEMDDAQAKGMPAELCAKKIVKGMERTKNELLIGGKERFGVYIKRFFPNLFAKIIRTAKVR